MLDENKLKIYRSVFNARNGQAVLADLMDTFDGLGNNYESDPRLSERMGGHRDVILYILESLGIVEDYEKIIKALLRIPVSRPKQKQEEVDT